MTCRTQSRPRRLRAAHQGNALVAAITGLVGVAIALILVAEAIHWAQGRVLDSTSRHIKEAAERAAQQAKETARAREESAREKAAAQATAQHAVIDAQQVSAAAALKTADQREAAWRRFYQPSPMCANPDSRPVVECANEFIRAKRAFDARYDKSVQ